ncbi:MAG: FAD-dependent monooxygenase [Pseudomonadota bacterium]
MTNHAVLIAGAGPVGLMLAGELALAGVDVAIIERRASQERIGPGALGLLPRTIEILDQRGIAERFISQGTLHKAVHFHVALDVTDFPTRHNYMLGLKQKHIERILAEWVDELNVPVLRGREIAGFTQHDDGVEVTLASGESLRAEYLIGCDGGRSVIRKTAGIDFAGWDAATSWLITEAATTEEPKWGFHKDATGTHAIGKADDGRVGIVLTERRLRTDGEPTLDNVREELIAVYGTDFGIHSPQWISRFTDAARQAATYRDRRVLLAGDAAHVHAPLGGQGLGNGLQDVMNLGWKLAQVVKRISPASLLDTYHAERHPEGARVLRNTMAQVALSRPDDRTKALSGIVSGIFALDEPRKRLAGMMSGLDVHYDLGAGHPLLGRRMPDLDLATADGSLRLFTLLHGARAVLLNLGEPGKFDVAPWADRVQLFDAKYVGAWELPVLGSIDPPTAVLIRPDGYVAWVGDEAQQGFTDALAKWFGPPEV